MPLPFSMKCKNCGRPIGTIISHDEDRLAPLKLEFVCPECVDKIAKSEAITLDSETSWGKVIAHIKGRRQFT
jgi:DNA-directed RNA polymerase subunit RPC12/RpoP